MVANRRLIRDSSGASAAYFEISPSATGRSSAPWPPTAGSCRGEKMRSSSPIGRPLTKATAPPVRCQSRVSVSRSSGGTRTSRGVGARSSKVPSTSSRKANLSKPAVSLEAMLVIGQTGMRRSAMQAERTKMDDKGVGRRDVNAAIRSRFRLRPRSRADCADSRPFDRSEPNRHRDVRPMITRRHFCRPNRRRTDDAAEGPGVELHPDGLARAVVDREIARRAARRRCANTMPTARSSGSSIATSSPASAPTRATATSGRRCASRCWPPTS